MTQETLVQVVVACVIVLACCMYLHTVQMYDKMRNLVELMRMLVLLKYHAYTKNGKVWSFVDDFERLVDTKADVTQFIFVDNDEHVTRSAVEQKANQIAHWAQTKKINLKQADTVALMMFNRAEYVPFWLGVSKVGVRTALLNTNITGKALVHSVTVSLEKSTSKVLVVDTELRKVLQDEVKEIAKAGVKVFFWDEISAEIEQLPTARPDRSQRDQVKESDPFLYIFTSGTTGLPKASKISHTRFYLGAMPTKVLCYLSPGKRMYNVLPLYHSAGGMLGAGGVLTSGATLVVRRKFSVKAFSADILKYDCQAVQYIGELARYLVNAPPNADDEKLNIKYALGNGLNKEIWAKFQARYNIGRVIEFYGATEGNVNMFNSTGRPGPLGYMPVILTELFYPVKIFRVNKDDKSMPLRDEKTGFCVPADFGEVGLIVNLVNNKSVESRFDGYSDSAASDKKLLKNALKEGDCYFNSGDLLYRTSDGFYYWSDRVGDTFRWKGENVATAEVTAAVSDIPGVQDACVFGVEVPGADGKVGMACVELNDKSDGSNFDWTLFDKEVTAHLPVYARPAFIRVTKEIPMTSTFKQQKGVLSKDGFDPSLIQEHGDEVYYYNAKERTVTKLEKELFDQIQSGKVQV